MNMQRLGQPITLAGAAATLPAPSTATADEGGVINQKTPDGRGYSQWELRITASAATTLTDVTLYVRTTTWDALAVPGFGKVLFPSLAVDTIGVRIRLDHIGLYDRALLAAGVNGGNVTVTLTPVVSR